MVYSMGIQHGPDGELKPQISPITQMGNGWDRRFLRFRFCSGHLRPSLVASGDRVYQRLILRFSSVRGGARSESGDDFFSKKEEAACLRCR